MRHERHWRIWKDANASPEYPWFVEHHSSNDPHDGDWHEYGSFSTQERALEAARKWVRDECKSTEKTIAT